MPFRWRIRSWVWFFVALGLLAAAAVAIPLWFNLSQQLRPEDLQAARARWQQNGPADYDLEYTQQGLTPEQFTVRVRRHRVESVTSAGRPLPPGSYPFDDMESLFRFIADRLEEDSRPESPRTYAVAGFSPRDGHVIHYVHSVVTRRERIQIDVELRPVPADGSLAVLDPAPCMTRPRHRRACPLGPRLTFAGASIQLPRRVGG
jgi:hypothetical protein